MASWRIAHSVPDMTRTARRAARWLRADRISEASRRAPSGGATREEPSLRFRTSGFLLCLGGSWARVGACRPVADCTPIPAGSSTVICRDPSPRVHTAMWPRAVLANSRRPMRVSGAWRCGLCVPFRDSSRDLRLAGPSGESAAKYRGGRSRGSVSPRDVAGGDRRASASTAAGRSGGAGGRIGDGGSRRSRPRCAAGSERTRRRPPSPCP